MAGVAGRADLDPVRDFYRRNPRSLAGGRCQRRCVPRTARLIDLTAPFSVAPASAPVPSRLARFQRREKTPARRPALQSSSVEMGTRTPWSSSALGCRHKNLTPVPFPTREGEPDSPRTDHPSPFRRGAGGEVLQRATGDTRTPWSSSALGCRHKNLTPVPFPTREGEPDSPRTDHPSPFRRGGGGEVLHERSPPPRERAAPCDAGLPANVGIYRVWRSSSAGHHRRS